MAIFWIAASVGALLSFLDSEVFSTSIAFAVIKITIIFASILHFASLLKLSFSGRALLANILLCLVLCFFVAYAIVNNIRAWPIFLILLLQILSMLSAYLRNRGKITS